MPGNEILSAFTSPFEKGREQSEGDLFKISPNLTFSMR